MACGSWLTLTAPPVWIELDFPRRGPTEVMCLLHPQRRSVTKVRELKVRGPRVRQCGGHKAFAFPLRLPLSYKCLLVLSTSRPLFHLSKTMSEGQPPYCLGKEELFMMCSGVQHRESSSSCWRATVGSNPEQSVGTGKPSLPQGSLVNYSLAKEPPGQP